MKNIFRPVHILQYAYLHKSKYILLYEILLQYYVWDKIGKLNLPQDNSKSEELQQIIADSKLPPPPDFKATRDFYSICLIVIEDVFRTNHNYSIKHRARVLKTFEQIFDLHNK